MDDLERMRVGPAKNKNQGNADDVGSMECRNASPKTDQLSVNLGGQGKDESRIENRHVHKRAFGNDLNRKTWLGDSGTLTNHRNTQ